MTFRLVSLLICLWSGSTWGAFPLTHGFGSPLMMKNPFQQYQYRQNNKQKRVDPNLLTCIGANSQDVQSMIRLTIRPVNKHLNPNFLGHLGHLGLGFGNMGSQNSRDTPQDWSFSGVILPSQTVQKAGTFQMAVFEGGRTFGRCKSSALGSVIITGGNSPFGPMGMPGPMSPMAMRLNLFASLWGAQQQQKPTGMLSNPAVLSSGKTIYSGVVHQTSYNQLVGRSVAACQNIHNGRCMGLISHCCTIVRDTRPANEVFVDPVVGATTFNVFGAQQGGQLVGTRGNLPLGGGTVNVVGNVDGNNGLF